MPTPGRDFASRSILEEALRKSTDADLVEVLTRELAARASKHVSKSRLLEDERQLWYWYAATIKSWPTPKKVNAQTHERAPC